MLLLLSVLHKNTVPFCAFDNVRKPLATGKRRRDNYVFARERSWYKRKLARKLKININSSINDQKYALIVPTLYSVYWLLHVSAVACHHQGAS
jgi:hypothetical protein